MQIQKIDEESIIRSEQEQYQHKSTRKIKKQNIMRDASLTFLKESYEQNLIDIIEYQTKVRHVSYLYIDTLDVNDSDTTTDDND